MRLVVLTPTEVIVREPAAAVVAESQDGWFCLEPRHVDFVAPLVPGVLAYTARDGGQQCHLAVDEGVLVKCGDEVTVSVRRALPGRLPELERIVDREFRVLDDRERVARTALGRLEAAAIRRFTELGEAGGG